MDSYYVVQPGFAPNRSKVIIEIDNSPYTDDAWANYLLGLKNNFNAEDYHSSENFGPSGLTLTIQGRDNVTDNPDIYYYEKVTEIEFELA